MSNQLPDVIVDALPYIDQGYDEPGVRDAVSFAISTTNPIIPHRIRLIMWVN